MSLKRALTGCAAALLGVALAAPAHAVLDHYKCYGAKDLKVPAKFQKTTVTTSDQFDALQSTEVKKPSFVCNPVSKNGSPIINPSDHLICYKIKDSPKLDGPNVSITDQFGTLKLDAKKPKLLCVPGSKTVVP
jgi:hypothetical protein